MRGTIRRQQALLMVGSLDERIPATHPLRQIKSLADVVLARMARQFEAMYSGVGRPSVPP